MKPWSWDASEADDIGTCLCCLLQNYVPLQVLVKSLWPLPITGVLCVCIRWCPDACRLSRSNCLSWRRLSSKCKEGLGFGVSFHQVSVCWLSITSSSKKSFVHKGWKLIWVMWASVSGVQSGQWTKGWRFCSAAFCTDSCPESLGSQRSSLDIWLNKPGSLGSRQGIQHHSGQWHLSKVWRELLTWEIHLCCQPWLVNTCVL